MLQDTEKQAQKGSKEHSFARLKLFFFFERDKNAWLPIDKKYQYIKSLNLCGPNMC